VIALSLCRGTFVTFYAKTMELSIIKRQNPEQSKQILGCDVSTFKVGPF